MAEINRFGSAVGRSEADGPLVGLMLATVANTDTGRVDTGRVIAAAVSAEEGDFDGVYLGDHLLHPHPMLESIVTLSVVAAETERVSLGPCVMLFGLRHPATLAKQFGTLAAFAPGRLRVGVGVGGEYPAEFEFAGVPMKERGKRMEIVLREVKELLSKGSGRSDAALDPVAPDVPFLLAGWKEISLRRAARYGDGWIGYLLRPASFGRRRALLQRFREEEGHGPDAFVTGMVLPVHVDKSRADAASSWARLTDAKAGLPEDLFIAGKPEQVLEGLLAYWEIGCREFVLAPADQGNGYLEQVDRIAEEILPELRRFS